MKYIHLAIIAIALSACGSKSNQETQNSEAPSIPTQVALTATQLQLAQLECGLPEMRKLGSVIQVNGFVDAPPQNKVSISFPFGGYLKHTKLIPGMSVRRGELLATLEDPQYIAFQQDYLTIKARLEYLSADLIRQESLNRDQSASDKALQLAKAEFKTQEIAAKALAEKLKLIGIDPQQLS
ncbi:MAG: efflux RND transporter periplasmic adaptor subunit, partial [Saprospiraceae bacterium]|nr:efflux RND transporter periplasmic adaptor subunit [Saprospiraceae bacterium]